MDLAQSTALGIVRDAASIAKDSNQLEDLRLGDFSSVAGEIGLVIKNETVPARYINIVDRTGKELGDLYNQPPVRAWSKGQAAEAVKAAFDASGIDSFSEVCAQKVIVHNSQIVALDPHLPGQLSVTPQCYSPFEVLDIYFEDPSRAVGPISEADQVVLRVPVQQPKLEPSLSMLSQTTQEMFQGIRVYTKTHAYTLLATGDPDSDKIGLYRPDCTHDFGRIPLVDVRRHRPKGGWFLPPLPYDILSTALALMIGLSDILFLSSKQSWGQVYFIGESAGSLMVETAVGPSKAIAIEADAGKLELKYVQGKPATEAYAAALDKLIEYYESNRSISGMMTQSTAVTGAGIEVEMSARESERRRIETMMHGYETDLARLMFDTLEHQKNPVVMGADAPTAEVDFRYVEAKDNALQAAQAQEIRFRQLLDSRVDVIASEMGITLEQARKVLAVRAREQKDYLLSLPAEAPADLPGLDKIDKQLPQ